MRDAARKCRRSELCGGKYHERCHRNSSKKALIVTTVSGFVPQFEMNNVHILQRMGYEVHYASNFRNPSYGNDNSRLDGTGIIRHQVDFVRSPFRLRENGKAYRQLKQLLKEQHFVLLHCHTPVGAALARIAAKLYQRQEKNKKNGQLKVIYTAHGFHFYKGAPLRNWLMYYPIERWLADFTDVLVTMNKEDYVQAKSFCRHKRTQVKYIPGEGVDTSYYGGKNLPEGEREAIRQMVREELFVEDGETLFLSVGELIPRKNHSTVIGALAELVEEDGKSNSFRYVICGQGVLKEELQQQIDYLGLSQKVSLLGYRKDIRALLYAADVFVFPSLQEGMPMALLEAAAAGLPLVVSDIRGNRDIVKALGGTESFTGKKELKQRLKEAMTDKAQGQEIRKAEHKTNAGYFVGSGLAGFDVQQVGRRMQNIYKEVSQ